MVQAAAAFCAPLPARGTQRRPATCRRVARACAPPPAGNDDDDVETDTVLSRRVFTAGVGATGLLTLINAVNLFGGDEFKDEVLRVTAAKRRFPSLFPNEQEPAAAARAPVDTAFAAFYFEQHAKVAVDLGLLTRAELEREEAALLDRSRRLFFRAGDGGAPGEREVFNYELYARVHSIATHSSPASRLAFSRALGAAVFQRLATVCSLPDPGPARRGRRGAHAADMVTALRTVLSTMTTGLGWMTGWRVDDFDPAMLSDEGRGELTVTCDDVFTLPVAMLIGEEQYESISPKVSNILLAAMQHYGCSTVTSEDYYLDKVYRPDASQFSPSQLVTQINFSVPV